MKLQFKLLSTRVFDMGRIEETMKSDYAHNQRISSMHVIRMYICMVAYMQYCIQVEYTCVQTI